MMINVFMTQWNKEQINISDKKRKILSAILL